MSSYRITRVRHPDGSEVITRSRLHPVWRAIGRAVCVWVALVWPLIIGAHNGTPSVLGWVLFGCWVPVTVAIAWLWRRSSGSG